MDKLLNVRETAEYLAVPESWVYAHARDLPCIKVGTHHLRFRQSDLDGWLDDQRIEVSA